MAAAPQNYLNKGLNYQNLARPTDISLNFIVDSANGNGLGIRSLKSNGYVKNVFMSTSAPLSGSGNPSPIAGYAVIQLAGNFNRYINGFQGYAAPVTSPSTTSITSTHAYVLTSLGTATTAQLQAVGFPKGITPAIGVGFIATASGSMPASSTVGLPAASQIVSMSIVGDPNLSLNNSNVGANGGAQIIVQFNAATSVSNPTLLATAPSDNSIIAMTIRLDGSSVNVDGL